MIHKFPKWVFVGGLILAFIAGFINVLGLLGFEHKAVSHLTGTTALTSISVANGNYSEALFLAEILLAFMLGAIISGIVIQDATLKLGRRYGLALFIEAMLLTFAFFLFKSGYRVGELFASSACGLQNAMASTYSGAILRTTHVTGIFTDIGILLGHKIRGLPFDTKRIKLFLLVICGFFTGGVTGAYCFEKFHYNAFLVPIFITFSSSMIYSIWISYHKEHHTMYLKKYEK